MALPKKIRDAGGMTPQEVAAECGRCRHTVYRWIREGKLPSQKFNSEIWIKREDVVARFGVLA